jgi:hypothetical protein
MKKTMILIAVLAVIASAMGVVGLAYAQSISTTNTAAAATATGTGMQGITDAIEPYLEEAFAKALGMTLADFDTQEAAGKSWLEIAVAQGKTEAEAQILFETAYSNAIAQALKDGKITQATADSLKAAAVPAIANIGLGGRGRGGNANGNNVVHTYLEEAFAKALGMTIADFDTQEAAGNSWLQIATAQGKTETEAQALLETAYSNAIAQALTDGKITQATADTLKAAAAPTIANVGVPGHGQPGGAGTGQLGGHGGYGHGKNNDSTSATTTSTTNP